jgi:hypothetical protein
MYHQVINRQPGAGADSQSELDHLVGSDHRVILAVALSAGQSIMIAATAKSILRTPALQR